MKWIRAWLLKADVQEERILRYLAAIGAVEQVSDDEYAANHVTENLAEDVTEAGITH